MAPSVCEGRERVTSRGVAGSLAALEMSGKSSERNNGGMYAALVDYLPRSAATLTKINMRRAAAPPISTVTMRRCVSLSRRWARETTARFGP